MGGQIFILDKNSIPEIGAVLIFIRGSMMVRKVGTCVVALLLCGIATTAWGFNKKVHREVSQKAVLLYKYLYPQDTEFTDKLAECFIEGSVEEDTFISIIPLSFQRPFNWHFYDPGRRIGRALWGANRSNTNRFGSISDEFVEFESGDLLKRYELAGRLVHHIQDMGSPPHAVPVYHTTKDSFDQLVKCEVEEITFTDSQLETLRQRKGDLTVCGLNQLLADAADRTIASVNSPVKDNGKIVANDWTGFWRKYEMVRDECDKSPKSDFGCYGKMRYWDEKGVFTKNVFEQYHKERITDVVEDSLYLLILLRDKSPARCGAGPS